MTLSITDIQRINALAHKHLKNNEEIAAETGHALRRCWLSPIPALATPTRTRYRNP